uniref:Uncharacterized protein n=1 Tax=Hucho hucho TaxID=62062 RepID=A0A4W5PDF8_9TELE
MTQHTSRRCKGYFNKESDGVLHQMTWPPQSLDLKPIEMLSDEADPRVKEKQPTSAQHMWELLQDCWKSIPGVPEPHPPVQFQLAMSLTKAFQRTVSQDTHGGPSYYLNGRGQDRERRDQSKMRAFRIIIVILAVLVDRSGAGTVPGIQNLQPRLGTGTVCKREDNHNKGHGMIQRLEAYSIV